jgi:hypothetical protein
VVIAIGVVLVAAITVFAVLALRSGDGPGPAAEEPPPPPQLTAADVANQFLTAFAAGDAQEAGRLTDNADAATIQLDAVRRGLLPMSVTIDKSSLTLPTADATTADEPFSVTWTFGPRKTWTYPSGLHLVKKDGGWRVRWEPALVHPRLAAGQTMVLHDTIGQPAVVDRDGTPLVNWAADGTTAADSTVAPRLTGPLGREAAGQGGAAGWYVSLTDATGAEAEVLYGAKATPMVATVSVPVQKAAQAAVDTQTLPTLLVAIQPSTGDILAVAQNQAAGTDLIALNGLFPPGSTFKIATATALIEAGIADTGTVAPCPGQATIGQRTIKNAGGFDLGEVPLHTAFAESCNTTFATHAAKLSPGALSDAAAQLGLGADFVIPGLTTEAGSVPPPVNPAQQVENSIGQGTVQASCFGLTLMTATVAAGHAVTPKFLRDRETTVTTGYQAPPVGVLRSLRSMMREVVTSGTGKALSRYGNVSGKTGTAEVAGADAHGWFAGYRDDLAFATLVQNAGTSGVAVDVTGKFLAALG